MGVNVSSYSDQPLAQSTMLITETRASSQPSQQRCQFRRQSSIAGTSSGISSQLSMPLQFYPQNIYQNSGFNARVQGFEATQFRPSAQPPEDNPPPYNSLNH